MQKLNWEIKLRERERERETASCTSHQLKRETKPREEN